MMILGLITQELHEQLLDPKNYQNRTNGVEELKHIISELNLTSVPPGSIVEFIHFLCSLLDDSNFKVLYGTLQVIRLLIQKLAFSLDKYFKRIVLVAVKALGDTRTVTRTEYMKVFRELMEHVVPQKVLNLVVGRLSHKNSRVREDVLNIITAAMLTHPRSEFDIPMLCLEVAPCLADCKRKVRQAALELFAVFDHCLDIGKKQPLTKAVDMVELNEDIEGLMAAVQARQARHILPRLSSEGLTEYALVVPKPGQHCSPQLGADLDWVLHGGRMSSARSYRNKQDSDRLFGSLGSLTDDLPLQRKIASAGKGKNKLPWEMSSLCSLPKGKSSEKIANEDYPSISRRLSPEIDVPSFAPEVPEKRHSGRRRESPARLRRSGSLESEILKSINFSETHSATPMLCVGPGGSGMERTLCLSANHNTPGSFLLPSYPLAALPGGLLTPTLSRHWVDSALSMSSTWPNKREGGSPLQLDPGPWRDTTDRGKASPGDQTSNKCSTRPLRATAVSTSTSYHQQRALSGMKAALPISPVLPGTERSQSHNGQRTRPERSLDLDLRALSSGQRPQDDEPLDMEEMFNSLQLLRNSAAKKRANVSLSGSEQDLDSPDSASGSEQDLDSPDSAVKLELGQDSPSRGSPTFTSPASESGLSSLCSPPNSAHSGTNRSPGNSGPSKPHAARVPSAKLRSSMSMDISCLQGLSQRDKTSPEVGVMGQRVTYSNRPMDCEDSNRTIEASPPLVRPTFREPTRAIRTAKDLQLNGNALTSAGSLAKETPVSPTSPLGFQSALKFDPPYQPSPPTVPPNNPKTSARLRRTRPSLSHCSDELSQGTLGQKQDLTESPECRPFSKPELVMAQSFSLISSDNWEKKIKGLMFLRRLAQHHLDTIQTRLHDVCLVLVQEVKNLRSTVSRVAVGTLGELYSQMQCAMDQELEATARALLQKAAESNAFIRQEVDAALAAMVQHCTPARCIHALLAGELSNLNSAVRACAGQHLADVLEEVGVIRLLSGRKDATDRIIQAVVKLAQDSSPEARNVGRRMLLFLSSHRDFEKILEKCIPEKDLPEVQNIVRTLKTKGLGETAQDPPSARGRRALPGSGTITALSLTRKPKQTTTTSNSRESNSQHGSKPSVHRIADKTEYIMQLCTLLNSKDFRERIKGIDQLVADCQTNPSMVVKSLFPVFDAFKARLQESNGKVNLYALESLQKIVCLLKGDMSQVVNILVPAIVDNHLNSKNIAVYCAATEVLGELMLNLDNILLLQPFCAKARFLSGKAKVDLIGKVAELVTELYPRKPKLVEQKALPLLWYLLGTSSHSRTVSARSGGVRGATANLCYALHAQMGPGLAESAASQLPNVQKALDDLLANIF